MKKFKKQSPTAKAALFAGATAFLALASQAHAQSSDALIDKLVDKGILTTKEAQDLREEADHGFTTAFQAKTGMPDWVTGYKFSGDFRGRADQLTTDNPGGLNPNTGTAIPSQSRLQFRYRLRVGMVISMLENLETGFQLASGNGSGNPLSNNTTLTGDANKKPVWINTAYGKWTAFNNDGWLLSTTIGKMENPFLFTPMIFDPDYTPEGAVMQGGYSFNDNQSIMANGGAFILNEASTSTQDPFLYGGQVMWNASWTPKLSTSAGFGAFVIASTTQLTNSSIPYVNQGNTYKQITVPPPPGGGNASTAYVLANNYTPMIGDLSATYKLDSFPFYNGVFPIKVAAEYINNSGVAQSGKNNQGYWIGVVFGKSGTKHTWDISYRYEYLEADAWYAQLVDDDNAVFYQNQPAGAPSSAGPGYYGGTNVKGHLIKANYSFTDALTFSFTCYMAELINQTVIGPSGQFVSEPKSNALHVMADMTWKF